MSGSHFEYFPTFTIVNLSVKLFIGFSFGKDLGELPDALCGRFGYHVHPRWHFGRIRVNVIDWYAGFDVVYEPGGGINVQARAYDNKYIGLGDRFGCRLEHRYCLLEEYYVRSYRIAIRIA